MTTDAEGIVVVVQHPDAVRIEHDHVLDRREWKREVPAQSYIARLCRKRDLAGISDVEQIDQELLAERAARAVGQLHLEDGLEAVEAALRSIALDDQPFAIVEQHEVADVGSARIQGVRKASPRVATRADVERVDE